MMSDLNNIAFIILISIAAFSDTVGADNVFEPNIGYIIPTANPTAKPTTAPDDAVPPVHVYTAMEALCPFSQDYFKYMIEPDQYIDLMLDTSVVNFEIVPFGNAEINYEEKTVKCQRLAGECDGDLYIACTMEVYPLQTDYLPMLVCLMDRFPEGKYRDGDFLPTSWISKCAQQVGLDYLPIKVCHDDPDLAWQLQKKAKENIPPEKTYVPWVVVNDEHALEVDSFNKYLAEEICEVYTSIGGSTPYCVDSFGTFTYTRGDVTPHCMG